MSATEFGDLAARMSASVAGVRACLVLSGDGLSLGVHPADGEARARKAWDALQQIGDPRRGFVDMGEETWVVTARGNYAAIIVASPEAKPGVLLDRMEAYLAAAEQARLMDDDPVPSPIEAPIEVKPELMPEPVKAAVSAGTGPVVDLSAAEPQVEAAPPPPPEPQASTAKPKVRRRRRIKSGDVDRVALAREFGRLIDESAEGY